jgi:hypothetical protein
MMVRGTVIDLTPCGAPMLTTDVILYAALRAEGESDFVAGCFMRNAKRATGAARLELAEVRAFLRDGPAAVAALGIADQGGAA